MIVRWIAFLTSSRPPISANVRRSRTWSSGESSSAARRPEIRSEARGPPGVVAGEDGRSEPADRDDDEPDAAERQRDRVLARGAQRPVDDEVGGPRAVAPEPNQRTERN